MKAQNGSEAEVFKFFRINLDKLQSSLLLNSMFHAFWERQKGQIMRYAFYPYLLYFSVALFYYLECMLFGIED